MLERYFVRPSTADRIRASWLGPAIERYAESLDGRRYSARTLVRRVQTLLRFAEFVRSRGAGTWDELPRHLEPFVRHWVRAHPRRPHTKRAQRTLRSEARTPVEQLLRVVLPGFSGTSRCKTGVPFQSSASGFFGYLREERGLSPDTVREYVHHLRVFEAFLEQAHQSELAALSPALLTAFLVKSARGLGCQSMQGRSGVLRVFLRYLHRQDLVSKDLSPAIPRRRQYRHVGVPRSITWDQVRQVLAGVDRRAPIGKRDYAMFLLLVSYGLRAREVAALTLDDIDWKLERIHVRQRKAGHSTTYPLSAPVGEAIVDYLRTARPETKDRYVFLTSMAPYVPLRFNVVSDRARQHLRRAGISVPRAGSHTFRHTCVQRLVDADLSFKLIGDYVGHRSPESTQIYGKVAVDALRKMVLGGAEEVL